MASIKTVSMIAVAVTKLTIINTNDLGVRPWGQA